MVPFDGSSMRNTVQQLDPDVDVVIVGYGPVGATLANLLGLRGVRTVVLEREATAYHLPRAVHFDDEVMRVFETIGLSAAISSNVILSPGMHFIDANGKLIMDWSRPAEITPQGWHSSYRFHQPDLEHVLRDGLRRWSSVTVQSRCDVFALDTDADGVTVRYESLSSGRLSHCRAKYVVGCDGARSLVRRFMGAGLDDLGFHERWLVLDFMLRRSRPDLGDFSVQHCDPVRPATYVRGTGNRRRWEITLHPGEEAHIVTSPERIWELLQRWVTPEDGDIERSAVYTFHSVVAEAWRAGRLLLAGDSAHQTPPFLGQGMCAGIRDASNLAWKLADVVTGRAPDNLLDSYESERSPHVREYIERAIRLGGIINTKNMGHALATLGRKADETVTLKSTKPLLGPGLQAGDSRLTGQLAPQPTLRSGQRLDQVTGYDFALLAAPAFIAALPQESHACIREHGLRVIDDPVTSLQAWLEENGTSAVLVRPDRYVLGAARNAQELAALLQAVPRSTSLRALSAAQL
jgi:3-(3-hydroxy-phenyl)propionate hydroxylase